MTNGQVIVAAFILIGFFAVLAGLIVLTAWFLNRAAYWWEKRQAVNATICEIAELEHVFSLPVAIRSLEHRGDAA